MASDAAPNTARKLWKPHPDDAEDVREAMECDDRRYGRSTPFWVKALRKLVHSAVVNDAWRLTRNRV